MIMQIYTNKKNVHSTLINVTPEGLSSVNPKERALQKKMLAAIQLVIFYSKTGFASKLAPSFE
jgi:hypothetical protein